ncbi:MAG: phosphate ABC transporter permease PstA [Methylophaga sp.]
MLVERVFSLLVWLLAMLVVAVIIWLVSGLIEQGLGAISWTFLTSDTDNAGRAGGIAPILVSTLLVLLITIAVALPLGLSMAIWLAEFADQYGNWAQPVRLTLDVLAGVPSIVYGLFGYAFFGLFLDMGFSILSGGLTLACMILPVFVRTCEMGLRQVDAGFRLGAAALGISRTRSIRYILLPAAMPAVTAGLVLGIGRATAETAALLFTSGYADRMPASLLDSGRTLSVHIYELSMNVTGGNVMASASALVLLAMTVIFNLLAYGLTEHWFGKRLSHEA